VQPSEARSSCSKRGEGIPAVGGDKKHSPQRLCEAEGGGVCLSRKGECRRASGEAKP